VIGLGLEFWVFDYLMLLFVSYMCGDFQIIWLVWCFRVYDNCFLALSYVYLCFFFQKGNVVMLVVQMFSVLLPFLKWYLMSEIV